MKKPFLILAIATVAVFAYKYIKTGLTALNLKANLKDLKLQFKDFYTTQLRFAIEFFNPENYTININIISADVYINNSYAGFINYNLSQTIQPKNYTIINNIFCDINNFSVAPELYDLVKKIITNNKTQINIKLTGKITANNKQLPFNYATNFTFNNNTSKLN